MNLALMQAQRVLGNTQSNPAVGCVIVNNNCIVSAGCTGINGRPHAEQNAINFSKSNIDRFCYFIPVKGRSSTTIFNHSKFSKLNSFKGCKAFFSFTRTHPSSSNCSSIFSWSRVNNGCIFLSTKWTNHKLIFIQVIINWEF